ncbi:MAG: hypothetical protein QOK19_2770, partial [Solirubrobacteraceae bacterium]|nr:hypothetical protein [Solirubrobacteraceae bacterium]
LSVLATLSNIDKHQLVHPTYSFLATDADEIGRHFIGKAKDGLPIVGVKVISNNSRLKHGTPWLHLRFDPAQEMPAEVKMTGDLTLGVAFGETGVGHKRVPQARQSRPPPDRHVRRRLSRAEIDRSRLALPCHGSQSTPREGIYVSDVTLTARPRGQHSQ